MPRFPDPAPLVGKLARDPFAADLRGRMDYASLNTNELARVEKLSLLILSEADGAVIREAQPPKM